ncbi:MAG: aldo/keto reductase [Dehalococcoidia bacterium]|nr:aldo/keto reductase [Dehalococcoidia bacterium]
METTVLGKTGLRVSRVGFGGIPIQRLNDEDAIAVVRRCLELGITYLDTANAYSTSEGRIGRAMEGWNGHVILSTKTQSRAVDGVAAHLAQSLQMLKVDAIDLYQFHNVSTFPDLEKVVAPGGPYDYVRRAMKDGKVKHVGITSHQIDVAKEAVKSGRFETVMYPFNFIVHEPGEELLALAEHHGVGFIAMKPFAGGMIDNATLAIKFLLQFPNVVPIPGFEKIEEAEQVVALAESSPELTAEEHAEIERIRKETSNRFCRRCDYCQPCTADIAISNVMSFPTMVKRMPRHHVVTGWIADTLEKVAQCTDCGKCEERCPYHLPIREMISENLATYRRLKEEWQASQQS